jgi:plastocyanin
MIWMVMNRRHQRREAYLEYRVTIDPAKLAPVTPYWLSVVPCVSDPQYTVAGGGKPGSVHLKSKTFTMPKASTGSTRHSTSPIRRRSTGTSGATAGRSVQRGCAPPPQHEETLGPDFDGREAPPAVKLTLAEWRGGGRAKLIQRPAGAFTRLDGDAGVLVDNFTLKPALVSIPRGSTLSWRFKDRFIHDATVVRGPRGFATATVRNRTERHRFTAPGEYKLYCSIHPVLMSLVVKVR